MTMFEWIKQANYDDMRKFIWSVYACGVYDGREGCEDSPPGSLSSFFGTSILQKSPKACAEAFENSYETNADFLVPERKAIEAFSDMVEAIIKASEKFQEVEKRCVEISKDQQERIRKLNNIIKVLEEK